MSVEICVCPPDRFAELLRVAEVGFGEDVPDDMIERVKLVADPARFVCAIDSDRIVSTGGVFTMTLRVPGASCPPGA